MGWRGAAAGGFVLLLIFWIAVARLGLAAHDVLLVYAVGGFAWRQQERETRNVLLGDDAPSPVRWRDFLREHHQILGCVLPGNGRTRSERILALAVSTLALLYWKTIFRTPKLSMGSVQGLRSSLWTLVVSKTMQLLMKRLIRFVAARQAKWHSSAGFLDKLQMTWTVLQYWVRSYGTPGRRRRCLCPRRPAALSQHVHADESACPPQVIGFMMLCVFLFLREGLEWWGKLSTWLVNMVFSLLFMDLVFCYIRFNLWSAILPLKSRFTSAPRYRSV